MMRNMCFEYVTLFSYMLNITLEFLKEAHIILAPTKT